MVMQCVTGQTARHNLTFCRQTPGTSRGSTQRRPSAENRAANDLCEPVSTGWEQIYYLLDTGASFSDDEAMQPSGTGDLVRDDAVGLGVDHAQRITKSLGLSAQRDHGRVRVERWHLHTHVEGGHYLLQASSSWANHILVLLLVHLNRHL